MIQGLMNYGALTTKAKALYGKRLRLADYTRMAALHAPEEVAEYLRGCPGPGRRRPGGSLRGALSAASSWSGRCGSSSGPTT